VLTLNSIRYDKNQWTNSKLSVSQLLTTKTIREELMLLQMTRNLPIYNDDNDDETVNNLHYLVEKLHGWERTLVC
jgi:hypothetical protein